MLGAGCAEHVAAAQPPGSCTRFAGAQYGKQTRAERFHERWAAHRRGSFCWIRDRLDYGSYPNAIGRYSKTHYAVTNSYGSGLMYEGILVYTTVDFGDGLRDGKSAGRARSAKPLA